MKKKILIFSASVLLLVALVVGVTFAAWNNSSADKDFDVTIGNNINLKVSSVGYNTSLDGDNLATNEGEDPAEDMVLVPNGAVMDINPLNTNNLLFGTFNITGNGGWSETTLGVYYDIKSFKLGDTIIAGSAYDVFDVKILAASDVTVDANYVSKSQPNEDAIGLVAGADGDQLMLSNTYYVFISFKDGFNEGIQGLDCDRASYIGKALSLNIELNAVVKK